MAEPLHNLPDTLRPDGDWRYVFAYHPMDVAIERAEGVFIFDGDGNRYFDVSGGPMAVNLPHNHPRMKRAIAEQLERYTYTHPSIADPKRAEFCRLLAEITPADLDHAFLVSGGSEAVETAIKLARQAQVALGNPGKYKVISHRDSYHGMTLATLGVSHNPNTQAVFEPMLPKWPHVRQYSDFDRPAGTSREEWGVECAGALEFAIHYAGADSVAAFLATGLSPGAGIAFLITGPATNISTLGLISGLHGRRAAIAFAAVMVTLAVSAGIAVNAAFGTLSVPSLAALTEEAPGVLQQAGLVLLAGLFLRSVVRRGPRAFVGELREGLGWAH